MKRDLSMPTADAVDPRADVGEAEHLQKPLERAVLPRRAVDDRKDDVGPAGERSRRARATASLRPVRRRPGTSRARVPSERSRAASRAGQEIGRPLRSRAEGRRTSAGSSAPHDRPRRDSGDLPLDRAAPEEDDDAEAAHQVTTRTSSTPGAARSPRSTGAEGGDPRR